MNKQKKIENTTSTILAFEPLPYMAGRGSKKRITLEDVWVLVPPIVSTEDPKDVLEKEVLKTCEKWIRDFTENNIKNWIEKISKEYKTTEEMFKDVILLEEVKNSLKEYISNKINTYEIKINSNKGVVYTKDGEIYTVKPKDEVFHKRFGGNIILLGLCTWKTHKEFSIL